MELIVEVGDPRLRDRSPGNPELSLSACEGRLAVAALDIGAERATYHLVGDHAGVGQAAFTFSGNQEEPGRPGIWLR